MDQNFKIFSISDAFASLNAIDDAEASQMMRETFRRKSRRGILDESTSISLNASSEEFQDVKRELNKTTVDDTIEVIDPEASNFQQLKDNKSYVGKLIIKCNNCSNCQFLNSEDLQVTSDSAKFNVSTRCPSCGTLGAGYTLVGPATQAGSQNTQNKNQEATISEQPQINNGPEKQEPEIPEEEISDTEEIKIENDAEEDHDEVKIENDVKREDEEKDQSEEEIELMPLDASEDKDEKIKTEKLENDNLDGMETNTSEDDDLDFESKKAGDEVDVDDDLEKDSEDVDIKNFELHFPLFQSLADMPDDEDESEEDSEEYSEEETLTDPEADDSKPKLKLTLTDTKRGHVSGRAKNECYSRYSRVMCLENAKNICEAIVDPENIKKLEIQDISSEEDPRLVYKGTYSDLPSASLGISCPMFDVADGHFVCNIDSEDDQEGLTLGDILRKFADDKTKNISIIDQACNDEVFSGGKEDALNNFGNCRFVSIETPVVLRLYCDCPEAIACDEEQVQDIDQLIKQTIEANKLSNYKVEDPRSEEYWIKESLSNLEDLDDLYETYIRGKSSSLENNFRRITGYRSLIDEEYERLDETRAKNSDYDECLEKAKSALDNNDKAYAIIFGYKRSSDGKFYAINYKTCSNSESYQYAMAAVANKYHVPEAQVCQVKDTIRESIEEECSDVVEESVLFPTAQEMMDYNSAKWHAKAKGMNGTDARAYARKEVYGLNSGKAPSAVAKAAVKKIFGSRKENSSLEKIDAEIIMEEVHNALCYNFKPALNQKLYEDIDEDAPYITFINDLNETLADKLCIVTTRLIHNDDGSRDISIVFWDPESFSEGAESVLCTLKYSKFDGDDFEYTNNPMCMIIKNVRPSTEDSEVNFSSYMTRKSLGKAINMRKRIGAPFVVRKSALNGFRYDLINVDRENDANNEESENNNKPLTQTDNCKSCHIQSDVAEKAKAVMAAYQNANKWLDSTKEFIYTKLNCPFFSSFVHNLAHTMPERFDKFGNILHTVNMEIPYPATEELDTSNPSIDKAFEVIFKCLDGIKDSLNAFIKAADDKYHGIACSAEQLLNDIEEEYPMLYRLDGKWCQCNGDMVDFDKYVMQYVEHKDKLAESLSRRRKLNEESDGEEDQYNSDLDELENAKVETSSEQQKKSALVKEILHKMQGIVDTAKKATKRGFKNVQLSVTKFTAQILSSLGILKYTDVLKVSAIPSAEAMDRITDYSPERFESNVVDPVLRFSGKSSLETMSVADLVKMLKILKTPEFAPANINLEINSLKFKKDANSNEVAFMIPADDDKADNEDKQIPLMDSFPDINPDDFANDQRDFEADEYEMQQDVLNDLADDDLESNEVNFDMKKIEDDLNDYFDKNYKQTLLVNLSEGRVNEKGIIKLSGSLVSENKKCLVHFTLTPENSIIKESIDESRKNINKRTYRVTNDLSEEVFLYNANSLTESVNGWDEPSTDGQFEGRCHLKDYPIAGDTKQFNNIPITIGDSQFDIDGEFHVSGIISIDGDWDLGFTPDEEILDGQFDEIDAVTLYRVQAKNESAQKILDDLRLKVDTHNDLADCFANYIDENNLWEEFDIQVLDYLNNDMLDALEDPEEAFNPSSTALDISDYLEPYDDYS